MIIFTQQRNRGSLNVPKILRISKIARTIAFLSIFAFKIVNEKNGKCSLKEFVANFKYFRNIYKKTKVERGGMVVRELIHLQQGLQDQLPPRSSNFLSGGQYYNGRSFQC